MGKIQTPRRSMRSVRPSPVSSGPDRRHPPSKNKKDRQVAGDRLLSSPPLDPSSSSHPLAHDSVRLTLPADDRLSASKLRNWAEEIIAHMRSSKNSDRQYGAILCTSLVSCNRHRLADGMDEEAGLHAMQKELTGGDLLSQSDLTHLFTDVLSALNPLLLDQDPDVRVSAAEALSVMSGMSCSIVNHLVDMDIMSSIEAALVENRNSIGNAAAEKGDQEKNEHCFNLLSDILIQLCSRSEKAVRIFTSSSIPSVLISMITGTEENNITNCIASAEVLLTTIEKNRIPGVTEKSFLSSLVKVINCLPVEPRDVDDVDKGSAAAHKEEEHEIRHYISLLCLLSLSLVAPAGQEDSGSCPRSHRLPISQADGDSLRKLLLSKISAVLEADFSTDLASLPRLLASGDLLPLLKDGQSRTDSQSTELREFNSKSKRLISLLKAMTVAIEALAKIINFETGDSESSDEEEDDDQEGEWSDFSGSEDGMNALSGKKEPEERKDERSPSQQNTIWRTTGAALLPTGTNCSSPHEDSPRPRHPCTHDDSKIVCHRGGRCSLITCPGERREESVTLRDSFNKLMKLVIRLLVTPVLLDEEKMILKKVPAGSQILDSLMDMQINILISIACCGEQLPDAMSEHDAETAAETMFNLIQSHSHKFVHHKEQQPNSRGASQADTRNKKSVHRSNEAEAESETTDAGVSESNREAKSGSAWAGRRKGAPDAHDAEQDRQIIRGCVYALTSLMQSKTCVCPSADQMRIFASLIHAEVASDDHSVPIACIKILGAFGRPKSDVSFTATISNLLMELLEESPLLLPVPHEEDQETSISGSGTACPEEEGECELVSPSLESILIHQHESRMPNASGVVGGGVGARCQSHVTGESAPALHLNLLIHAEILDNLMDMFTEDVTTDQILIKNNLLPRFVTQEKVFSELFRRFRRERRAKSSKQSAGAAGEAGEEGVHQNQTSADSGPENGCVMNRQELAVIQTVAHNFKRFIRYKEKMLPRTGNKNKKGGKSQFL